MILIDDRPKQKEPEVITPPVETIPQPEPKKSANNSALIWGIVIVVLLIAAAIIYNIYSNSNKDGNK